MPITRCNSVGFRLMLGLALLIASIAMLTPGSEQPGLFWQADKLAHLGVFMTLAFLADAGWPDSPFNGKKFLPLLGYGAAIELLQLTIPMRSGSLLDLVADVLGLLLYGLLILPLLRHWKIR